MDYDIYVLAILRVKIFKFMQNLYHRFKIYKTYILPYYNGRLLVKNVFNVKIIFRMHFVLISHTYHGLCRNCLFLFLFFIIMKLLFKKTLPMCKYIQIYKDETVSYKTKDYITIDR